MRDEMWRRFQHQKSHATRRGIGFRLSFEHWLRIWIESGHLDDRGRRRGQYVMARIGDVGPYAIDNVKIVTCTDNQKEQRPPWLGRRHTEESRRKISAGKIGNKNGRGNKERIVSQEQIAKRRQTMISRGFWT